MKKILTIILFVFISLCVHSEWNTFDSTDLLSEKNQHIFIQKQLIILEN
jgi:hypothetical protein